MPNIHWHGMPESSIPLTFIWSSTICQIIHSYALQLCPWKAVFAFQKPQLVMSAPVPWRGHSSYRPDWNTETYCGTTPGVACWSTLLNLEMKTLRKQYLTQGQARSLNNDWASQVRLVVKNLTANGGDIRRGFDPWVRKIPCKRAWQPCPVSLPGESYGQRSLVGYST